MNINLSEQINSAISTILWRKKMWFKTCFPFHNLAFLKTSVFKEKEHKTISRLLTGSEESYNMHNLKRTSLIDIQ